MPLRLLCLTAHPDDEAGAFGGALLLAAARGFATAVVCLTDGAAGSYREPGQSDGALAKQRREEFAEASRVLRVAHGELLSYQDGRLRDEPFSALAGALVGALRRHRPHVVATFGAEGGVNLHPDHTAVSLAATAAFHWAAREGMFPEAGAPWAAQKLYYAGTPFLSPENETTRATAARTPATLRFRLPNWAAERKREAFRQHGSQAALLAKVEARFGNVFQEETYLLAAARRPVLPERDIWDGVEED